MDYRNLPLSALRAFVATADRLSVKRAAEILGVTSSAISHQLKSLEDLLGAPLLDRTVSRQLALTPAGQRLYAGARQGFEMMVAAIDEIVGEQAGDALVVSVAPFFAARWLTPRLHLFWERFPQQNLRLHHSYYASDFMRDGVDLGITWGSGRWPGVEAELLIPGTFVPVCSPDYLRSNDIDRPEELLHHRLLCEFDQRHWEQWFTAAGVTYDSALSVICIDDSHSLLRAACDGYGVALFFKALLGPELRENRLVIPFDVPLETGAAYFLTRPASRPFNPRAANFVSWLIQELRSSEA